MRARLWRLTAPACPAAAAHLVWTLPGGASPRQAVVPRLAQLLRLASPAARPAAAAPSLAHPLCLASRSQAALTAAASPSQAAAFSFCTRVSPLLARQRRLDSPASEFCFALRWRLLSDSGSPSGASGASPSRHAACSPMVLQVRLARRRCLAWPNKSSFSFSIRDCQAQLQLN